MGQRNDPILTLLERSEDPDLRRVTDAEKRGIPVGAGTCLRARAANGYRQQCRDPEARGIPPGLRRHRACFVRGGFQVVEPPTGKDKVVDHVEEWADGGGAFRGG